MDWFPRGNTRYLNALPHLTHDACLPLHTCTHRHLWWNYCHKRLGHTDMLRIVLWMPVITHRYNLFHFPFWYTYKNLFLHDCTMCVPQLLLSGTAEVSPILLENQVGRLHRHVLPISHYVWIVPLVSLGCRVDCSSSQRVLESAPWPATRSPTLLNYLSGTECDMYTQSFGGEMCNVRTGTSGRWVEKGQRSLPWNLIME